MGYESYQMGFHQQFCSLENYRECLMQVLFLNGPFPASFSLLQLTVNMFTIKFCSVLTVFEPRSTGLGSYSSADWATTTARYCEFVCAHSHLVIDLKVSKRILYWSQKNYLLIVLIALSDAVLVNTKISQSFQIPTYNILFFLKVSISRYT